MDALSLSTDGIICPTGEEIEVISNYVLPFNLQLKTDVVKLNLKHLGTIKLNTVLDTKKLNLIKLPSLKLNTKLPLLKLSLQKCED